MALWYQGPNPTVDLALLRVASAPGTPISLQLLLIQRAAEPFKNHWAFPAGFIDGQPPKTPPERHIPVESPETAARREFLEETGQPCTDTLHFVGQYSGPGRDPRETTEAWTTTTAFVALTTSDTGPFTPQPGEIRNVQWHPLDHLPPLAFDHSSIIVDALTVLLRQPEINPLIKNHIATWIATWHSQHS